MMAFHADRPVTAGLSQVAQMDRGERTRLVRELSRQHPSFRSLMRQLTVSRAVAFASGLALALAVMLLVNGVPVLPVSLLVLGGLIGFGYVATVLTDHRFDLLLAVLGAHRTDELHGLLMADSLYGDEDDAVSNSAGAVRETGQEPPVAPGPGGAS